MILANDRLEYIRRKLKELGWNERPKVLHLYGRMGPARHLYRIRFDTRRAGVHLERRQTKEGVGFWEKTASAFAYQVKWGVLDDYEPYVEFAGVMFRRMT